MAIILALVGVSSICVAFADPADVGEEKARRILDLTIRAMQKANETIEAAQLKGLSQPIIDLSLNHFSNGANFLELSNSTFFGTDPAPEEDWGNYTKTSELALMAMQYFRNAAQNIMKHWGETGYSAGWRGLVGVIKRAEDFIQEVEELVEQAKDDYPDYNFTSIDEQIDLVKESIENAKENLVSPNQNYTATEIGKINSTLRQITNELKKLGKSSIVKGKRISKFINHQLEKSIKRVQNLAIERGIDISEAFSDIDSLIVEAEMLVAEGDLKAALKKIKEAHRILLNIQKELLQAQGKGKQLKN